MREAAKRIYTQAIEASKPRAAVLRALDALPAFGGRLIVLAIGKAAWEMARVCGEALGERIDTGIVITKHDHSMGEIDRFEIYEAGHPVPDEDTLTATRRALSLTENLTRDDLVLFLVSGGGSALFESIDFSLEELRRITGELLAAGADITEINTVRKHVSNVKGGRFAAHCFPAHVYTVILSDVLGDRLDTIASGPSAPDETTKSDALAIANKYGLTLTDAMLASIEKETPKEIPNATYFIGGGVDGLCAAAKEAAETLGFRTELLEGYLTGEARDEGMRLASLALSRKDTDVPLAMVAGGETVVHLRGNGRGGRNQELALAAATVLDGHEGVSLFSVGSDGTDGPTDAAGGYADGGTVERIRACGLDARALLNNNDAYTALRASGDLIVTGPTGTNVNDVTVALVMPK